LRDKALAERPDLKAAHLSERAADANIRLQDAQRIPDLTLGGGIEQVPSGTSSYTFGVGITLPVSDRNQGERAKALIEKKKAQNQEQLITNQVLSDVDKALVAFEMQKRRVDLYRTGVITKVNDIQRLTETALKAGESSTLDLLDAIRTRRDTLAGFYQTLFDYQMSLLDLELATATPLHK
jgi:cobalt-zinc-cadmium efflux system outer membrane protein